MRDTYRRYADDSARALAERKQEVEAARRRLARSHCTLEQFGPLVRRRHGAEVDAARRDIAHLPGSIDSLEKSVEDLRRGHERNTADLDRYEATVQRLPEMERERATMRQDLDHDALLRLPTAGFRTRRRRETGNPADVTSGGGDRGRSYGPHGAALGPVEHAWDYTSRGSTPHR